MNSQDERMINLLFDDGGPIEIAVGNTSDPLHPKLLIRTSICDNPDCDCREVRLEGVLVDDRYTNIAYYRGDGISYTFNPGEGGLSEAPPLRMLSALVDVDSGEAGFDPRASAKEHDPELLAWLKEALNQSHMEIIRKRWRLIKGLNQDNWRNLDWSWWQPGELICRLDVFPDDFHILFSLEDEVYWANDLYCINPGCGCKEVGLVFCRFTDGKIENLGAITATLPSGRFSSFLDEKGNGELLRRLLGKLRHEEDKWDLIKKRKKDIAPIGREIIRLRADKIPINSNARNDKDGKATQSSFKKVGRNDKCPCGSGKKYKKCCLGKI